VGGAGVTLAQRTQPKGALTLENLSTLSWKSLVINKKSPSIFEKFEDFLQEIIKICVDKKGLPKSNATISRLKIIFFVNL